MSKDLLKIYTNTELSPVEQEAILAVFKNKFQISDLKSEVIVDKKLAGGYIVKYEEFTLVLPVLDDNKTLEIRCARELDAKEKATYSKYAFSRLNIPDSTPTKFMLDTTLVGGIKIKYLDKELDLSLDTLLDQLFS